MEEREECGGKRAGRQRGALELLAGRNGACCESDQLRWRSPGSFKSGVEYAGKVEDSPPSQDSKEHYLAPR